VYTSDNNIHIDPEHQGYVDNIVGQPTLITHPERGARMRQDWLLKHFTTKSTPYPGGEAEGMSARGDMTRAAAMAMAAAAGEALARYQALEDKYGKEPAEGSVLKFTKVWSDNGGEPSDPGYQSKSYSYAARRVGNLWYATGARGPNGVDWESFMHWMDSGHRPVEDLEIAIMWDTQPKKPIFTNEEAASIPQPGEAPTKASEDKKE
jgi:hypothetical protein